MMPCSSSQSRKAWTPLVKALKVRTGGTSRSGGRAATNSVLPMSIPAASRCVRGLRTGWPAWTARARLRDWRFRLLIALRFSIVLIGCMKCLTGPPPKKVGQSPERGPRSLRPGATKNRLARVATRLTSRVCSETLRHHWQDGLHSRQTPPANRLTAARASQSYSPTGKSAPCSFANHALQRTAPCVTAPASAAAFPPPCSQGASLRGRLAWRR